MKIATFNINNVRRRLPNLLAWLDEANPHGVGAGIEDSRRRVSVGAPPRAGYGDDWHDESRWNGVAILARTAEPVLPAVGFPATPMTNRRGTS